MPAKSTALATVDAAPPPVPMFGARAMGDAFSAYQQLQHTLDERMADQVITIEGRKFRRKGYWRGVATAFNLSLELVEERREVHGTFEDGHDNFVFFVVYRATAPNGRAAIGDGACAALEKANRREANKWARLPWQATEHNVRSHAHTRAFNRAVSSLVGFGEVSAEELEREDDAPPEAMPAGSAASAHLESPPAPASVTRPVTPRVHPDSRPLTEPQRRKLFASAKGKWPDTDTLKKALYLAFGVESTKDLRMADYEQALDIVEKGPRPIPPVPEVP
jgi:hypothetical protein